MNNPNTPGTVSAKRFAWSAVALCIGCCAFIPMLVLFGVTSAAGLGIYFEFASVSFFIASLIMFSYLIYKNKKLFCKKSCSCKDMGA